MSQRRKDPNRIHCPKEGRPARFERWEVGDSLPVARSVAQLKKYIRGAYSASFLKMFEMQEITPTLTRVTRIA